MSSYEDYDRTSKAYDATRQPVAIKRVLARLAPNADDLMDMVFLDAGCGTGQFTEVLLEHGAQVEAVELSPGMLGTARNKLGAAEKSGQLRFHLASITAIPLPDNSVDGVVINQVLHHLPEPSDGTFPVLAEVLREVRRVLRPGGALVLNTCGQAQLAHGFWYFHLMGARVEAALLKTYAPLPQVNQLLAASGFSDINVDPVLDEVLTGDKYHQAEGPLSSAWRDGDSTWALLTPDELETTLELVRSLKAKGELEGYRDLHDARRPSVGQLSLVTAR